MVSITFFDKDRDLAETSQSGYVDLYELLGQGIVPSDLNVSEESFNNIEDPRAIYGKPEDQFHAMELAKVLNKRGAAAQKIADQRAAAAAAAQGES